MISSAPFARTLLLACAVTLGGCASVPPSLPHVNAGAAAHTHRHLRLSDPDPNRHRHRGSQSDPFSGDCRRRRAAPVPGSLLSRRRLAPEQRRRRGRKSLWRLTRHCRQPAERLALRARPWPARRGLPARGGGPRRVVQRRGRDRHPVPRRPPGRALPSYAQLSGAGSRDARAEQWGGRRGWPGRRPQRHPRLPCREPHRRSWRAERTSPSTSTTWRFFASDDPYLLAGGFGFFVRSAGQGQTTAALTALSVYALQPRCRPRRRPSNRCPRNARSATA